MLYFFNAIFCFDLIQTRRPTLVLCQWPCIHARRGYQPNKNFPLTSFPPLPLLRAREEKPTQMLAWKEKVADRLARLLADSPPAPSSTAVEPQVSDLGSLVSLYLHAACLPHIPSDLFSVVIPSPVWGGWDLMIV